MRHQISKKERALLTFAGAQRLAGPGTTPTARQVRRAHDEAGCSVAKRGIVVRGGADATDGVINKVCGVLSGIGGETDAECGSFWGKVKDFASSATSKAAPLAPLFGPTAMVAVPIAQQMTKRQGGQPAQAEDGLQEISGMGFGPERGKIEDYTYIFGDNELSTEDRMILGEGGGSAELASLQRQRRRASWPRVIKAFDETRSSSMGAIPHDAYRAAIVQRARKLGGRNPSARQMAAAQASVDQALKKVGLFVAIPGAMPGRVTR